MRINGVSGWCGAVGGWRAAAGVVVTVLALSGFGALGEAQEIPRLPGPITMTRTAESPGAVAFNHETHVDPARPACTTCHPREFRILKASPRRAPITHAEMDKGRYCGTCHTGKKAFALDDCAACHEG
jgi:c(7)-type cytochrome triheme protein